MHTESQQAVGRRVTTLKDARMEAGRTQVQVPTADLPSGTYFLCLKAGETVKTRRMTVVR